MTEAERVKEVEDKAAEFGTRMRELKNAELALREEWRVFRDSVPGYKQNAIRSYWDTYYGEKPKGK